MTTSVQPKTTTAFYFQAAVSFGVALVAVIIGLAYLPVDTWVRAFFGLASLYLVTSAFTLAKVIRDQQETTAVVSRVDQARLEKLLAEHDPFRTDGI